MRILLIDNNTRHLAALKRQLATHQVEVQEYQPGLNWHYQDKDLVVLSGGGGQGREVKDSHQPGELWYEDELKFIEECPLPLLGICMGFELIAYAHGSPVVQLPKGKSGLETFTTRRGQALAQVKSHDFAIQQVNQKHFDVLAESDSGLEIIRHKQRPILATQFHPELGGSLQMASLLPPLA